MRPTDVMKYRFGEAAEAPGDSLTKIDGDADHAAEKVKAAFSSVTDSIRSSFSRASDEANGSLDKFSEKP